MSRYNNHPVTTVSIATGTDNIKDVGHGSAGESDKLLDQHQISVQVDQAVSAVWMTVTTLGYPSLKYASNLLTEKKRKVGRTEKKRRKEENDRRRFQAHGGHDRQPPASTLNGRISP